MNLERAEQALKAIAEYYECSEIKISFVREALSVSLYASEGYDTLDLVGVGDNVEAAIRHALSKIAKSALSRAEQRKQESEDAFARANRAHELLSNGGES